MNTVAEYKPSTPMSLSRHNKTKQASKDAKEMKHYDIAGLEKVSREGLEAAMKDKTTSGWVRVI
jgi:hypothetical protein